MPAEIALEFLRCHPPFFYLSQDELRQLVRAAGEVFHRRGDAVPEASQQLIIVRQGALAERAGADGRLLELRDEGSVFGLSVEEEAASINRVAHEDTILLRFPRAAVESLKAANARFADYFERRDRHRKRFLSGLRADLAANASGGASAGERLLFTTTVRELCQREPVWCPPETTVRAAAQQMHAAGVSSLLVLRSLEEAASGGIVTNDDLRSRVIAEALDLATPVSQIMSQPLRTIEAPQFAFEALLVMMQARIHCLPVVERGRVVGLVTGRDLMNLQGSSPLLLARDTARQTSAAGLRETVERAAAFVPLLVRDGTAPEAIGRLVAGLTDRVTERLLVLAVEKLGPAPVPWCWVAMGSEGRREQTFITDQDNALIYADPLEPEATDVTEYFRHFAEFVGDGLEECGFPACPAGYMARNPRWRQPASAWRAAFGRWIESPSPDEVLHAIVFFDLRAIGGEAGLVESLQAEALAQAARTPKFLQALARAAVRHAPPLGFLRGFVVQPDGPHEGEFDLKLRGTMPILDLVRLLAVQAEVRETNTFDRLRALERAGRLRAEEADELADTLEFLLLLRLRHQVEQRQQGKLPSNYLPPERLSSVERATLREAFRVIERRQEGLRLDFQLRGLA